MWLILICGYCIVRACIRHIAQVYGRVQRTGIEKMFIFEGFTNFSTILNSALASCVASSVIERFCTIGRTLILMSHRGKLIYERNDRKKKPGGGVICNEIKNRAPLSNDAEGSFPIVLIFVRKYIQCFFKLICQAFLTSTARSGVVKGHWYAQNKKLSVDSDCSVYILRYYKDTRMQRTISLANSLWKSRRWCD